MSPRRFAGTIAHKLLEHALSGLEPHDECALLEYWDKLVSETEERMARRAFDKRFIPLEKSVRDLEVLRAKTVARALEIMLPRRESSRTGSARRELGGEVTVQSADSLLAGRIDRVVSTSSGIVLQDYKTGAASAKTEADPVKPEFRLQLLLYAAMYFQTTGKWPAKAQVVPLSGATLDLPFTESESADALATASSAIRDVNAILAGGANTGLADVEARLARPSPESCKFCAYRPSCSSYLAADRRMLGPDWPADVWGHLDSVKMLGNGTSMLAIVERPGNIIYVRELEQSQIAIVTGGGDSKRPRNVGVFGARRTMSDRALDAGTFTAVFA